MECIKQIASALEVSEWPISALLFPERLSCPPTKPLKLLTLPFQELRYFFFFVFVFFLFFCKNSCTMDEVFVENWHLNMLCLCEWTVKTSSVRCPGRNSSIETATGTQRPTHSRTRRTAPTFQKFFYRRFDSVMSCRHVVGQLASVKTSLRIFFFKELKQLCLTREKKKKSRHFLFCVFLNSRFVCVRSDVVYIYKEESCHQKDSFYFSFQEKNEILLLFLTIDGRAYTRDASKLCEVGDEVGPASGQRLA